MSIRGSLGHRFHALVRLTGFCKQRFPNKENEVAKGGFVDLLDGGILWCPPDKKQL
jgi:hypothetical protein